MKKLLVLSVALLLVLCACSAPSGSGSVTTSSPATTAAASAAATEAPKPSATVEATATPEPASAAPSGPQQDKGTLGNYEVAILDAALAKTYDGKPAVVITYEWKNNSDKAAAFITSILPKVFQDGVECSVAVLDLKSKVDIQAQMKQIKPGVTLKVFCAYGISDKTKPIQVEVAEIFTLDDSAKVVKEFSNLK